jgi:SPP1 family predicted phage head-tail adaptor
MRANHLVDIQEAADATDWEDETATWTTVAQAFAEIIPLTGKELVDARQIHADITHRIRIPWRSGITAYHRILWGSRVFHLLGPPINVKEGNRKLVLSCMERT